ncbi:MAG TPA: hypothetical protein DCX17_02175 [Firmicutes bacterium]|nr:hypothetical protein [Bacillota bacterium]
MKKWSPNTRIGFVTIILILGPFLIGAGQYIIIGLTTWFPTLDIIPLGRFFVVAGLLEFGLGYILADAYTAEYRHRTKMVEGPLPLKEQEVVRFRKWPLWIAGITLLVIGILASFIFSF